ncbi:hypothetical protein CV102_24295 [Natronococcus pandeyae]|uniref:DUF7344 domain-containing protein n=1 Tax=Natronococcus pandeyae TaxID=2055836 RepID=A0A8J8PZM2_9EURY|nr:helix-turn-helix transcriptional regulator [Natronococcus pandeyae]TYL36064.1 hypothetical protein CV102_24295 [Natronococcus pandeyae]
MTDSQTVTIEVETTYDRSPTDLFDAFSDKRRQHVLEYLSDYGIATLDELTTRVASREKKSSEEQQQQIAISLVHHHLPKLEETGIVSYDSDHKNIQLLADPAELAPYLALATDREFGTGGQ